MQTVLFYAEKIEVFIKTQNNFSKPLQLQVFYKLEFRKILQCKTVLSRAKF